MRSMFMLFLMLVAGALKAARVDTVKVKSEAMDKEVRVVVVTPEREGVFPVVYLLHGYGGNEASWITIAPEIVDVAERDGLVLVCPDGAKSWYLDSPVDPQVRYETFIADELIRYVDSVYPTCNRREARAIAGLSMGGYGAMMLAMRHVDLFGAAGSTSGGMDIRPFPRSWELNKVLGNKDEHPDLWDVYVPINQMDRLKNGNLALIVDCGYSDFFFEVNEAFHRKLLQKGIEHDFYVRPGNHELPYWKNSILYQLLFFHTFFEKHR